MIKLFIFDMGGVLVRNFNILPQAAEYLGLSYGDLFGYIKDDLYPLMEGRLGVHDFWKNLEQKSGIEITREFWTELFRPRIDQSTSGLITRLKKYYPVVCGTNTMDEHYRIHQENGDYLIFDRVYSSHLMRTAKPKPGFFNLILEKEGVKPEETVFTDDLPENVEAAASLGINSFMFTDAAEFEKDLADSGLGLQPF